VIEVPGDDAVELLLSILAPFDGGPSYVGRRVAVQPLFPEHREERSEERSGETSIQHCLNVDNSLWRTGPLWDCRNVVARNSVVHLVDEDTEESGGLFVRVRLELGVDLDDEGGGDGRKKTSLWPNSTTEVA